MTAVRETARGLSLGHDQLMISQTSPALGRFLIPIEGDMIGCWVRPPAFADMFPCAAAPGTSLGPHLCERARRLAHRADPRTGRQ